MWRELVETSGSGDMMSLIAYSLCKRFYVVCSGLTSFSTIFQSYITTLFGCDRELNAHFYSAVSLKYHVPDTWHDTTLSHIILTLGRPVLALPRKSECQARCTGTIFYDFSMSRDRTRDIPFPEALLMRTSCNFILFIEYFERVTLLVA